MIDLIVTIPEYTHDEATKRVWSQIAQNFPSSEGECYYKHPVLLTTSGVTPELTLITRTHHPVIIRCLPIQLQEVQNVGELIWTINNEERESPLLEAEDFTIVLKSKFDKNRVLRKRLEPFSTLAFPLIRKQEFFKKFPNSLDGHIVLWADSDLQQIIRPLETPLSSEEWRNARSIAQGVNPLTKGYGLFPKHATSLGDAIKYIDRDIALLDEDQRKAALQIAPGPQQIHGLAGTGKTILLAMKAANIHLRYPEKRILFTFYTQSLYNQIRTLITKFYRNNSDMDPDWDHLHIRHAWGGSRKRGVYYDACLYLGISPIQFSTAKFIDHESPLRSCCKHLMSKSIQPAYDFILIDEAQDFPPEFFQVLYRLSKPPHQIYWVYDELQNLLGNKFPTTDVLFGRDEENKPLVSLDGEPYPGGIDKDIILHRSYRCPQSVLMLAHAIGLGLYSPEGCVQMIPNRESWESLGYELESGELVEGYEVVIYRPPENSPNPIIEYYKGSQKVIQTNIFDNRENELNWIADSIFNDINIEKVLPEYIVVICLDALKRNEYLPPLQKRLLDKKISSTIPGIVDDSAAFAEPGHVTLSTVFRAKGNESYIVYIFNFDALYDYIEEIQNRNQAFTSISRSKAWVRISGVGNGMKKAVSEINKILSDQPRFRFLFPNMEKIRSLDTETPRRRLEMQKGKESISRLLDLNDKALEALKFHDPELFKKLANRINEAEKRETK